MMRTLWDLQRAAWGVALRAAVLPLSVLGRRTDRHLLWRLREVCFGAARPGVYPEVALAVLTGRQSHCRILEIPEESYNVSELETLVLAALTSALEAETVFEFGTGDGCTTRNLAGNTAGHVYTLNISPADDATHRHDVPVGARFLGTGEEDRITQLWGDSRTFDFTPYQGRCQLVFIDADHSDAAVQADSRSAFALIDTRAAIIVWHDALRFGVQQALPRFRRDHDLPIHLVAGTNLAVLCFAGGNAMTPAEWAVNSGRRGEPKAR